jgi:hypothetical protein
MMRWLPKLKLGLLVPVVWLAFGLSHRGEAFAAALPNAPALSTATTTQIAFADFDGDRQPDLAVLQGQPFSPFKTAYSITLALSTGNRESIGLVGPSGGLRIFLRDVNGDSAMDLVVTARWLHRTVAVFLNDGAGRFISADPARFPMDLQQSDTELGYPQLPWDHSAFLLGAQPPLAEPVENSSVFLPGPIPGLVFFGTSTVPGRLSGSAFSGRAPPSFSSAS